MPGAFRCHHEDIHLGRRHNRFEMNGKTMAEQKRLAFLQVRSHLTFIDRGTLKIRCGKEDDVSLFDRFTNFQDFETVFLRDWNRLAAFVQTDNHLYSTVLKVERVRVTL